MRAPEIHLSFRGTRASGSGRAHTLGEQPPFPLVTIADNAVTRQQYRDVCAWLDVEKSARWQPLNGKTYCNVYASDLVHVLGGYLPRVWWSDQALRQWRSRKEVKPVYGDTLGEMGANRLHDWLEAHGSDYGWTVVRSRNAFVDALHQTGAYGLVSARNRNRSASGHITVAFPGDKASKYAQSQAGTRNKEWFSDDTWHQSARFDSWLYAIQTGRTGVATVVQHGYPEPTLNGGEQ